MPSRCYLIQVFFSLPLSCPLSRSLISSSSPSLSQSVFSVLPLPYCICHACPFPPRRHLYFLLFHYHFPFPFSPLLLFFSVFHIPSIFMSTVCIVGRQMLSDSGGSLGFLVLLVSRLFHYPFFLFLFPVTATSSFPFLVTLPSTPCWLASLLAAPHINGLHMYVVSVGQHGGIQLAFGHGIQTSSFYKYV